MIFAYIERKKEDRQKDKGKEKMVRRWKRILIGVAVVLTVSAITEVGMCSVYAEEMEVESEYTESGYGRQESEESEEQESDVTEISTPDETEMEEEQILDMQSGNEESIFSEAAEEKNDSQTVIQREELFDESAEAGSAIDGGFLTGRGSRRARSTVQFLECYGDQLNESARDVYDAMKKAWGNGGTDKFTVNFSTSLTFETTGTYVTNEAGERKWKWIAADGESTDEKMQRDPAYGEVMETLRKSIQGGFDACIYDCPEIFWLKNVTFGYTIIWTIRSDGSATGKISSVTVSGNESWTGAKNCVSEFQTHVSDAVNSISAGFTEDMSDARKMKQIHDYICAKCVYKEGTYAHSAYGTFYNGKVVCEGYAKAFKILCNRMGLTCVLGSGTVHKTSSDGAHMWNYVLLDGGWYMVDVTWDDGNTLSNRYLFAGSESDGVYYKISEERTNYTIFSNSTIYGFKFVQPALQEDTYHEKIEAGYIPASCESSGQQTWRCQLCNEIIQEEIPAAGHSFGEWKIITKASCEQSGVQSRTCQNCQKTETETVPATGHSFGEWKIITKASCEQSGVQSRICQNCQKTETETLPATGHSFGAWKIITKASCEQSGVQSRTCQNCQKTETETVPATGHSYDAWKISRGATVLGEGEMRRSCQNTGCSSYQTKAIAKLPGFVRLNASRITLQTRQSTSGLKVTDMAKGDRIISWKSNKSSVATVNKNGKITGKKAGTAVITVTLASGVTGQCKVKVQKEAVAAAGLDISLAGLRGGQLILKKGQSVTCKATVKPFTCKTKVTYSSGNSKIAKISKKGKIRAVKNGKTKITIRAGKKKKVIWVTVKKVK